MVSGSHHVLRARYPRTTWSSSPDLTSTIRLPTSPSHALALTSRVRRDAACWRPRALNAKLNLPSAAGSVLPPRLQELSSRKLRPLSSSHAPKSTFLMGPPGAFSSQNAGSVATASDSKRQSVPLPATVPGSPRRLHSANAMGPKHHDIRERRSSVWKIRPDPSPGRRPDVATQTAGPSCTDRLDHINHGASNRSSRQDESQQEPTGRSSSRLAGPSEEMANHLYLGSTSSRSKLPETPRILPHTFRTRSVSGPGATPSVAEATSREARCPSASRASAAGNVQPVPLSRSKGPKLLRRVPVSPATCRASTIPKPKSENRFHETRGAGETDVQEARDSAARNDRCRANSTPSPLTTESPGPAPDQTRGG